MNYIIGYLKKHLTCIIALLFLLPGCRPPSVESDVSQRNYIVRVLILTSDEQVARETGSHFRQSWNLTTEVTVSDKHSADQISNADCIYIAGDYLNVVGSRLQHFCDLIENAAQRGALVYFEPQWAHSEAIHVAGLRLSGASKATIVTPVLRPFPPLLRHFESLFRTVTAAPVLFPRTHYEQTHLPGFVQTVSDCPVWTIDFNLETEAASVLAATADGNPLLTWREIGVGGVLWSFDFSRRQELFQNISTIRDFSLGYPDSNASNFHYGAAGLDYLFRNSLVNLAAKLKYGLSIERVPGPNGAPALSWQNHLDCFENWDRQYPQRWSEILMKRGSIPSFTVRSDLTRFDTPMMTGKESAAHQFGTFCIQSGIPVNPHLTLEPLMTPGEEQHHIQRDIEGLKDIGIPEDRITGADNHVFYTHAQPIWQTFHSLLDAGLFHNYGGATLSPIDLFPWFFCTSSAYAPFCPPFMPENRDGRILPLVISSPLPARPLHSPLGKRGILPAKLRMPVTFYFHPEFIEDAVSFEELHSEFQSMILESEWFRDVQGYAFVTEPQAASAHIANRTADITATVFSDRIVLNSDSGTAMSQAGEFRDALGVRIEYAPDTAPFYHYESCSNVRYIHPATGAMEIALNPDGTTTIGQGAEPSIRFERINLPFSLESTGNTHTLRINEPGLRRIRYALNSSGTSGYLPETLTDGTITISNGAVEIFQIGNEPLEIPFTGFSGDAFNYQKLMLSRLMDSTPTDPKERVINFGTPEAREFYKRGWCLIDEQSENHLITWSTGYTFSELAIPLSGDSGFTCSLKVRPYFNPSKGNQTLSVMINGHEVLPPVDLRDEWQFVTFEIEDDHVFPGINMLVFHYNYVSIPAIDHPGNRDFRPLAVMFERLVMIQKD